MKIISILGARPQFIKAAVISRALCRLAPDCVDMLVHTGQHYDTDMSDVFFSDLQLPRPKFSLEIGGGSHGQNTGRMLEKIERVLIDERPDWVLLYGDTDSTLAGALAAVKLQIPIAHIEAGLRSFNRVMPEEINRLITDHVSSLLFSPTEAAVLNLQNEGIDSKKIRLVGDVMYDSALYYRDLANRPVWFDATGLTQKGYVLCTIHRAENTDDPHRLDAIFNGLSQYGGPIILPLHPRTRKRVELMNLVIPSNVTVVGPVGYREMVCLETQSKLIATDSGGVQKEAFFHERPCVTLRDETEWVELVEAGVNCLVGADSHRICEALKASKWNTPPGFKPYGSGVAGNDIVSELLAQCAR